MAKKLNIIGCGDILDRSVYNESESDTEYWTVNNCYTKHEDIVFTALFELHHIEKIEKEYYRRNLSYFGEKTIKEYFEDLKKLNIPIYMQHTWKEIPKSVEFPIVKILNRFPRGYFSNSIAWMTAFAIIEGFEEISIFGVGSPLDDISSYFVHKMSVEYYLGIAEALGIKIYIPHDSDLLKSKYLYGYQENQYTYQRYCEETQSRKGFYTKFQAGTFFLLDHI